MQEREWTLTDVLLPLPGHNVIYPPNLNASYLEYFAKGTPHNATREAFPAGWFVGRLLVHACPPFPSLDRARVEVPQVL